MSKAEAPTTIVIQRAGVRSANAHVAAVVISGFLLLLAFPRPGWGWLAHVALVPMAVLALRSGNVRRLLWTSYAVSLIWWLFAIRWMTPVTFGGYVALSFYMAVYVPAALWTLRVFDRRYRMPAVLALPLAWVPLEYLRGTLLAGGFGWFALSHSQAPWQADQGPGGLVQVADLVGEWGVSFLVAMTNGLVVDIVSRPWFTRRAHGGRGVSLTLVSGALLWICMLGGAWVYGMMRIAQVDSLEMGAVNITVVQTDVPQSNKSHPSEEQRIKNWRRLLDLTRQAASMEPKPDVIAWPETIAPTAVNSEALAHYRTTRHPFWEGKQFVHEQIAATAKELDVHLLVGAHAYWDWKTERVTTEEGEMVRQFPLKRSNAVYHYRPDGVQTPQRYEKIHLVPFGEFTPWVDHWPWLKEVFIKYLTPYDHDYSLVRGSKRTVFEVNTRDANEGDGPIRVVTPICFEDAAARTARRMLYDGWGAKRADVLVNITNDGWFSGSDQPVQHVQMAVLRSIENRVPTARSVNRGVSGFIDSVGDVGPLVSVNGQVQDVEGIASFRVLIDPRRTWFGRLGQGPVIALVVLAGVLLLIGVVTGRLKAKKQAE